MAIHFENISFRDPDWVHCFSSRGWSEVLFQYSSFNIQCFCILNELSSCDHKKTFSQYWEEKDVSLRSTGNMLKEMQNIFHRKRTWRQDSIGEIYLEELLGHLELHRKSFCHNGICSQWDMVFFTFRKVVVFVGDASKNG